MRSVRAIEVHIAIDHQHLGHLALELRVTLVQVVAHAVGLEFVRVQDAPDGGLARTGQSREPGCGRMRRNVRGQGRQRPQLGGQAQINGFATGQINHEGLGRLADLRGMRTMEAILQTHGDPGGKGLVDALVDGWPRHAQRALNFGR